MVSKIKRGLRGLLVLPVLPLPFRVFTALSRIFKVLPNVCNPQSEPQRILVVNLTAHVGDLVMCLPFLEKLHAERPNALIEIAVAAPMGSLLRELPFLHQVHELTFGPPRPPVLHLYRRIGVIVKYGIRVLSKTHYDLCLLPRWGTDPNGSAYLAYLTDAPSRYGQDPREEIGGHEMFPGTRFLMTSIAHGGHGLPEAVRELRLLVACGITPALDEASAEKQPTQSLKLLQDGVSLSALLGRLAPSRNKSFVVIAPGASAAHRRWPVENFAEIARRLYKEFDLSTVAIGAPGERILGEHLERLSGGVIRSLIGQTTLPETIALLSAAQLFIGNDSGPAHIAGGLGVPSLILSTISITSRVEGPSSPLRVRPVGPLIAIVQPEQAMDSCTDTCISDVPHCILAITPTNLLQQARELLSRASS